jgi:hypothetical protein
LEITDWYAAAVVAGLEQSCPSFVPVAPPSEAPTSPPSPRTSLMTAATCVSLETGSVPSQEAVQPPSARMKDSRKAFSPVAAITWPRSGAAESSV